MLLEDIYFVQTGELVHKVMKVMTDPVKMVYTNMVDGWTQSKAEALAEAIGRGGIHIMIRRKDCIAVNLENTQELMERKKKKYKIAAMSHATITIVLCINGFDSEIISGNVDTKESNPGPARMFAAKYNTSQFTTSRHVLLKSGIPKKMVVKNATTEDTVTKATGEAFSIGERMNKNYF
jgi:hypothetical protein